MKLWTWGLVPVLRFFPLLVAAGLVSIDSLLLEPPALAGVRPPESGLGGRLAVRIPRGGCGNALILIVFRSVFPAAFTPGVVLILERALLLPAALGVDGFESCDDEGARNPLFEKFGIAAESETEPILPVLFRVFVVGNAGNADVGGPYEGLDGLGNAAAILKLFPG